MGDNGNLRIPDFQAELQRQIEEDGTQQSTREERLRYQRIHSRTSYWRSRMSENNENPPGVASFTELMQRQGGELDVMDLENNAITQALAESHRSLSAHAASVAEQHAHKRRRQSEAMAVYTRLTGVTVNGTTRDAPEFVPLQHDTPLHPPRPVSPLDSAAFMNTPARNESRKRKASAIPRNLFAVDEEYAVVPPSTEIEYTFAVGVPDLANDAVEWQERSFSTAEPLQDFTQVMDCGLGLLGGKIVPLGYLKIEQHNPSFIRRFTSLGWARPAETMELTSEGLEPFDTEPITSISSHGDLVLAKGFSGDFHVWQYANNTGTFAGPVVVKSTEFGCGAAHALVDGAIVGFDVDLLSDKTYAVLRKALLLLNEDDGRLAIQPEPTNRSYSLMKGRVQVPSICTAKRKTFILAAKMVGSKKKNTQEPCPHLFVVDTAKEKIEKIPGFNDGVVQEVVGNANDLFLRTISIFDGKEVHQVFYKATDDLHDKKFKEFLDKDADDDGKSLAVKGLASCDHCCVAHVMGSKVCFLYPPTADRPVKLTHCDLEVDLTKNMSEVLLFDGSFGSLAGFVGPTKKEAAVDMDSGDEEASGDEDTKPAAKGSA